MGPGWLRVRGEEVEAMLGMASKAVAWAYLGCLGATLLCVIWGLANWNRGDYEEGRGLEEWVKHEDEVEETL